MAITDYAIAASLLHAEIKAQGVDAVTTVPDLIQFALHDRLKGDPEIRYIECAAENQALTVATGLYIGGKKPMVMMQNQGLFNCINTLRSVGIDARIPMVLSVGAFGREFSNLGKPTTESGRVCLNKVEPVMAALGAGRDVLFDIDWQGTQQLADASREDLVSVFILPPSTRDLEKRLLSRAQDSADVVASRMAKASDEISHYREYDYILVNADLDQAVKEVRAILQAERLRRDRQIGLTDFVKRLRAGY